MVTLDGLRDAAALLVIFGLAGWLLGLAAIPERLGTTTRTRLSLALSVPATVLAAAPGVALHRLGAAALLLGVAGLAGLAAWRQRGALARLPREGRLRLPLRPDAVRLAGLAAVVGWLAVLGPQVAMRRPDGLLPTLPAWYYWRLVTTTLAEGGIPETIGEWGRARPFPVEYVVTTLHTAAAAALAGGARLALAEEYRVAVAALGLLAGYALWRRWLPPWWAWLASILALSAGRVSNRFVSYRPETFGLVLVLWSAWLLDEAFERRSGRWGALAGMVSASAFLAHAEAWLLTAPLWGGIALGRALPWLLSRRARSGSASGPALAGSVGGAVRPALGVVAASGLAFAAVVALVSLATDGGARVAGLVGGARDTAAAPPGFSGDPTWALLSAMYAPADAAAGPPDVCGAMFERETVRIPYAGLDLGTRPAQLGLGLAALLVLLALPRAPASARRAAVTWAVFVLGVAALAGTVCAAYDTFVPERAGPVRIMPLYVFGLAGLLSGAGWAAWAALRRAAPADAGRVRWAEAALAALVAAPLLLFLTPMGRAEIRGPADNLPAAAYEAYAWMGASLPPDAVILANGFTEGSLGAITGRTGWLDGRSPYLEEREWLFEARRELLEARAYFHDPAARADLLPPEVDYVVAARPGVGLGGSALFPTDMDALRSAPNLRLVRAFDGGSILLFAVVRRNGADRRTSAPAALGGS